MRELFWFFCFFMICLLAVALAAEDERLEDMAERLSASRETKKLCKRAKHPAPNRAAKWCKYAR